MMWQPPRTRPTKPGPGASGPRNRHRMRGLGSESRTRIRPDRWSARYARKSCRSKSVIANDSQYYFEAVESLSTLPLEHHALFLALCPLCAAKYTEFVKRDPAAMERFRAALGAATQPTIPVSLEGEDTTLTFVDSHFLDLQTILQGS